jgi:hypothetical protein
VEKSGVWLHGIDAWLNLPGGIDFLGLCAEAEHRTAAATAIFLDYSQVTPNVDKRFSLQHQYDNGQTCFDRQQFQVRLLAINALLLDWRIRFQVQAVGALAHKALLYINDVADSRQILGC